MARAPVDGDHVPASHPDPGCNTGYAEPKPKNKEQAHIPGAKQPPGNEEGGLEHAPDPAI
ncbi:MAG: hypothetical protein ABIO61_10915 [Thermomonas sp.]